MPEYKLQVLVPDAYDTRKKRKSLAERAREVFRQSKDPDSETGKRVDAMINASQAQAEYDLPAALESARKAERLSRELRK